MTNEEFQRLVLEKLDNLELGQKGLEEGQNRLEERQESLEREIREISERSDAVIEPKFDLMEFKREMESELKCIKRTMSRIEIATADNWSDIARLKLAR